MESVYPFICYASSCPRGYNAHVYVLWYNLIVKKWNKIREQAIGLRVQGKTYPQIQEALGIKIPKGNLFYWFKKIKLTPEQAEKIREQKIGRAHV